MKITIAAMCLSIALPLSALAHSTQPYNNCNKPFKPYSFTSQWEIDHFNNDIDSYKRCIAEFVDDQNIAIKNHAAAAEEAIEEWNDFIRELN